MGKKIDRVALVIVIGGLAFALFLYAFENLWISLGAAILFMVMSRFVIRRLFQRAGKLRNVRRRRRAAAERLVSGWAFAPDERAFCEAAGHFAAARGLDELPGDEYVKKGLHYRFRMIHAHPDGQRTDATYVTRLWNENRDAENVVILSTGYFEEKAARLAASLADPKIYLCDAKMLTDAVAKSGLDVEGHDADGAPTGVGFWVRVGRMVAATARQNMVRSALYGVLLLALYFVVGINMYLILALVLLGLAGVGLKRPRAEGNAL